MSRSEARATACATHKVVTFYTLLCVLKMGLQAGCKFWRCIIDQNPKDILHCQLNFTIQSAASSQKTFHDFKLPWWVAKKLILLWLQPAAVVPYSEPSAST